METKTQYKHTTHNTYTHENKKRNKKYSNLNKMLMKK